MSNGLVVGKFLPYHKGHEALIKWSKTQCDKLYVIVCADDKGIVSVLNQHSYLGKDIIVIELPYMLDLLPYNYENNDDAASKKWASVIYGYIPKIDFVFSSEIYGKNFAKHLGAKHRMFDQERDIHNISGTEIRTSIRHNWKWLTDLSKKFHQKTITIAGTESTGKTVLFNKIQKEYPDFSYMGEYGRIYNETTSIREMSHGDIVFIGRITNARINAAKKDLKPFVICDTDSITTQGYANFLFKNSLPDDVLYPNQTDEYLYIDNCAKYVQDGLRLSKQKRNILHITHLNNHIQTKVPMTVTTRDNAYNKLLELLTI
jgi:HTH-type transcriptional repressor of NAD biosynthesis genes